MSDPLAGSRQRRLRLAVNLRTLHPGKIGGLEDAFRNVLDRLLRTRGSALQVTLFTSEENASSFGEWRERVRLRTLPENGWMAALMEALPAYDVLWCPLFFLEPSPPPIPAVVTIPDLQHETFPQFFTPELLALRLRACRESAQYSRRALTLSEYSKRDLVRTYRLPDDQVQVVPLDCGQEFRRAPDDQRVRAVRERFGLSAEYGLYPANTWPHKNHRGLLQAIGQYRRDYGNPPQIVLTGATVEGGIDLDREIRDADLADVVRHLGYVDREQMPDLYDGARFLVFVSLFEGFGIPVIEAMRRGTPIVASNTTSVPELAGDCALLVDPCDPAAIACAIHDLLNDPDGARERAARGRHRAERFSYGASAEIVWRVLEEAATMPAQPRAAQAPGARPKVFVVTPSFNQGRFLRETIDSVLRQDYPNLEYFVADGGSSDDSVEILRSYGDRVEWASGPDGGQSAAIAKAWGQSDAEIVAWLNSDDTYLEGAVSAAVDYLLTHPEMAMVYGRAWYTDAQGHRLEPYPTKPFDRAALAGECFICQPAAFVRREVFRVIALPDPSLRYCMDYDLWIRLSRYFRVGYFDRFLATSRLHPDTKTLGQRSGVFREIMEVARRHYSFVHRSWALGYVYYRWTRLAGRLWFLPMPIRRRLFGLIANRMQARLEGSPYEDGWVGRRTLVTVAPDETGRVTFDCESPFWPFRRRLRIRISCDGRLLATHSTRGPGRFTLTFQLPPEVERQPTVLLEANRSFVPFRYGISTDQRALSFKILRFGREAPAGGESRPLASHRPAAGGELG